MNSEDDSTFSIKISNLLFGSRGPIPELFYRTFEGTPFDDCTYCGTQLRSPGTLYRISKLYCEGDLQQETAICFECYNKVRGYYSQESMRALKQHYQSLSFQFEERRRIATDIALERLDLLTADCLFCKTLKLEITTFMVYSMFEGDQIIYHPLRPRLVCEKCIITVYELLSKQTKDDGRRFFEDYFGLPPDLHPVELNQPFIERIR